MENKLNWDAFSPMFGDWARYFKDFFESEKAWDIYQKLKSESKNGAKILPPSNLTYRAFTMCNPSNLKLIIYGSDPYPGKYKGGTPHATGLTLDCSNSPDKKMQPSLTAFWDGLKKEMEVTPTANIEFLATQGILLLNRAMTVEYQKISKHMGWWDDFHKYFIEEVITPSFPAVPIIFLGKEAARLDKYVFKISNPTYILDHPSAAARTQQTWDTKGVFQKVNTLIKGNLGEVEEIIWDVDDFDKFLLEVPF
jgi:uracil DNA glycosylase